MHHIVQQSSPISTSDVHPSNPLHVFLETFYAIIGRTSRQPLTQPPILVLVRFQVHLGMWIFFLPCQSFLRTQPGIRNPIAVKCPSTRPIPTPTRNSRASAQGPEGIASSVRQPRHDQVDIWTTLGLVARENIWLPSLHACALERVAEQEEAQRRTDEPRVRKHGDALGDSTASVL